MAAYGYGLLKENAFLGFSAELKTGAWGDIATKKWDGTTSAADLIQAPQPVIWKIRLTWGIAAVLASLGAPRLVDLDADWDAAQRRLYHGVAAARDDKNKAVQKAADRLAAALLTGAGTAQTNFSLDDEVDFGRAQIAATSKGGPLADDAEKLNLGAQLADVQKATDALAAALGRSNGQKRHAPSKQLRLALSECAAAFNAVHEQVAWFVAKTPPGTDRDGLAALLQPLDELLSRNGPVTAVAAEPGGEVGGEVSGAPGEGEKPGPA
ncbi:MAG: hypothetical protein IPK82_07560 [Polyangiaceae bacterium]|nr:hypothetical protein [Polyangiaceae bacterium]